MAISVQIQEALNRIRQTQSLMASFKASAALQGQQIATLTNKVTDLQAKLDAGGTIGSDDLSALAEITTDIDQVNADIQSAVPANTGGGEAGPGNGPSGGGVNGAASGSSPGNAPDPDGNPAGSAAPESAPQPEDMAQHAADAEAASQAKPL